MNKKKKIVWTILAVLLLPITVQCEEFGGLEGVVIIGENSNSGSPDSIEENDEVQIQPDDIKEKLELSFDGTYLIQESDSYFNINIDISLINWKMQTQRLSNAVEAVLIYQDEYKFPGMVDFGEHDQIGVLEQVSGTIIFTVPIIVAFADTTELQLELTVDGNINIESLSLKDKIEDWDDTTVIPFSYADRTSDELELHLGENYLTDSWNGDSNEAYKWVIQNVSIINWSNETIDLEDALYMLLTYMNKYGFEAQGGFQEDEIEPLEIINADIAFHIPNIVAEAKKGMTGIQIRLQDNEWEKEYVFNKTVDVNNKFANGKKARMGIKLSNFYGTEEVPRGVLINKVFEGSPAERAQLKKGDIITEINGNTFQNVTEFKELLSNYTTGSMLILNVYSKYKNNNTYHLHSVSFHMSTRDYENVSKYDSITMY